MPGMMILTALTAGIYKNIRQCMMSPVHNHMSNLFQTIDSPSADGFFCPIGHEYFIQTDWKPHAVTARPC
jgi:hypothetical protein